MFDEYRYFVPGNSLPVFRMPASPTPGGDTAGDTAAGTGAGTGAVDVAIAICEDLWQQGGPVAVTRQAGAALLVVPNASPYERGKDDVRLALCLRCAGEAGAALAYSNLIGGQDELVFDGGSLLVAADGELLARGPQFEAALIITDLDLPAARGPVRLAGEPVDAGDGTVITIRHVEWNRWPARREASSRRSRSGRRCRITRRSTARWSWACGTTCARTASAR